MFDLRGNGSTIQGIKRQGSRAPALAAGWVLMFLNNIPLALMAWSCKALVLQAENYEPLGLTVQLVQFWNLSPSALRGYSRLSDFYPERPKEHPSQMFVPAVHDCRVI